MQEKPGSSEACTEPHTKAVHMKQLKPLSEPTIQQWFKVHAVYHEAMCQDGRRLAIISVTEQ